MSDEYDWRQDAEAQADLDKRDASERDASRTRKPQTALGGSPVAVTQWPCQGRGCPELVDVTEDAVYTLGVMNAQLERIGEPPLPSAALCPRHEAMRTEVFRAMRDEQQRALPDLIRQLKESGNPAAEAALLSKLRRSGHPDVDGLLSALTPTKRKGRL